MLLACYVAVQRTFGTHGGITSMSEITPSPLLPQGMKSEIARRRFTSFYRCFGKVHLYLAQHAAFPLALTPDLLYRLWANFSRDIHRKQLNIPWVAVPDLLLSSLCNEVSQELYEMDVTVRNMLLVGQLPSPVALRSPLVVANQADPSRNGVDRGRA